MMHLAYKIYTNEKLHGGVSEKSLIAISTDYLCPKRFEDIDEAEAAARQFIEFCRGRAWVFTEVGSTKEGEGLYQFTHRTFLEYFAASYLVRIHRTPETLGKFLLPRIAKSEWDVVAQLAFQIQNKTLEDAGDELLLSLLNKAREAKEEDKWNMLSFAARCLEFIVPSPKVARIITTDCIELCLNWGLEKIEQDTSNKSDYHSFVKHNPNTILNNLSNATTENRGAIANTFEKVLTNRINIGSESEALLALEIGIHPYLFLTSFREKRRRQKDVFDFWQDVSDKIFDACWDRIEVLCPQHYRPCFDAFKRGRVSAENLIKWHGLNHIISDSNYIIFPHVHTFSLAERLLNKLLAYPYDINSPEKPDDDLIDLEKIGKILHSTPIPWINEITKRNHTVVFIRYVLRSRRQIERSVERTLNLNSDQFFGLFSLFSICLELSRNPQVEKMTIFEVIKDNSHYLFNSIRWTLLARFERVEAYEVQAEMDLCKFTSEQQDFIWRWIRREIDLVNPAALDQST